MILSRRTTLFAALIVLLSGAACATLTGRPLAPPTAESNKVPTAVPAPTAAPTTSTGAGSSEAGQGLALSESTGESPGATASPAQDAAASASDVSDPTWPPPVSLPGPFADVMATAAQQAAFDALSQAMPPERDDVELARLYKGWSGSVSSDTPTSQPLAVGTIQNLNVLNLADNSVKSIEAELMVVGEHAYFWFDTGPGSVRPGQAELVAISSAFDDIYERSVAIFGSENNPGVDGDPRLHVVNASPAALCGDDSDPARICTAGYYSASDSLPPSVDANSNGREMFVMNTIYFGSDFYLNILAHEFRHMIEDNYDSSNADWEAEGSATLAEDLLGFSDSPVRRANLFLSIPDQQLNRWTDESTLPYYGQGYLFNRYIYDRLGPELYRQFGVDPEDGLLAIDNVALANGIDQSGEALWLDWLVALAIHNHSQAPERYRFQTQGIDTATMTEVDRFPTLLSRGVHQYAAHYYRLSGEGEMTLAFAGSTLIPLLDTAPASGERMWLANRTNYSHLTLSREVDLTGVDKATLNYRVYHDIEAGYDFGYVFVSEDEGQTWQPLVAAGMQGLSPEDDPSKAALVERFYTGHSEGWRGETIDLSRFAGQRIHIRFAYVTDPIHTLGGLAIDDISIPEIGYYDDVEGTTSEWRAEGFAPVTATIPQKWFLQLITFPDGIPSVDSLPLTDGHSLSHSFSLDTSEGEAILIVAAAAPMTLEQAHYRLEIGQ